MSLPWRGFAAVTIAGFAASIWNASAQEVGFCGLMSSTRTWYGEEVNLPPFDPCDSVCAEPEVPGWVLLGEVPVGFPLEWRQAPSDSVLHRLESAILRFEMSSTTGQYRAFLTGVPDPDVSVDADIPLTIAMRLHATWDVIEEINFTFDKARCIPHRAVADISSNPMAYLSKIEFQPRSPAICPPVNHGCSE
jgi:hypothetical protein